MEDEAKSLDLGFLILFGTCRQRWSWKNKKAKGNKPSETEICSLKFYYPYFLFDDFFFIIYALGESLGFRLNFLLNFVDFKDQGVEELN